MSVSAHGQIASAYSRATNIAWDMKARFDMAGFDPSKVLSLAALSRPPVIKKRSCQCSKERTRQKAGSLLSPQRHIRYPSVLGCDFIQKPGFVSGQQRPR